jgi:hypothetical protein
MFGKLTVHCVQVGTGDGWLVRLALKSRHLTFVGHRSESAPAEVIESVVQLNPWSEGHALSSGGWRGVSYIGRRSVLGCWSWLGVSVGGKTEATPSLKTGIRLTCNWMETSSSRKERWWSTVIRTLPPRQIGKWKRRPFLPDESSYFPSSKVFLRVCCLLKLHFVRAQSLTSLKKQFRLRMFWWRYYEWRKSCTALLSNVRCTVCQVKITFSRRDLVLKMFHKFRYNRLAQSSLLNGIMINVL